jgi:hypothetical protein
MSRCFVLLPIKQDLIFLLQPNMESTKPTKNKAENGNQSKLLLCEADFIEQKDGYFRSEKQPLIRFKVVKEIEPIFGGHYWDYRFEIFQRPYFWNLLGSKRWKMSMQTDRFTEGLSFSHYRMGFT